MKRGDVWWADVNEKYPVVLLSAATPSDVRTMRIVPPATAAQKRGFVVLSGAEALDPRHRQRILASVDPSAVAVGIEVAVGSEDGLPHGGVVRVALPRQGKVFCTWMVTLSRTDLIARIGALSPEKQGELDNALRLAAIE